MSIALTQERAKPFDDLPLKDFDGKISDVEVSVSEADARSMDEIVAVIHQVTTSPHFQNLSLAFAPEIARVVTQRVQGLFSGFDFHLTPDGPKLIEINTNAGGAFYTALIEDERFRRGQFDAKPLAYWSKLFIEHVRNEWALAGKGRLRTVAIVDDAPDTQFLRLEFQLAARMLNDAGITAVIADPGELVLHDNRLWHGTTPIDLVYNRLTSFALDRKVDQPLHDALRQSAVVVTPDPRNHALLACKRNLTLLSDDQVLRETGLNAQARALLTSAVPKTVSVTPENAPQLWADRDTYYFKPASGYGSRGVYAGAKLTAKTWDKICATGEYVAQTRVAPSRIDVPGSSPMRYDIRNFSYGAKPFMKVARVYRGQTTNFRTPAGGFARVKVR